MGLFLHRCQANTKRRCVLCSIACSVHFLSLSRIIGSLLVYQAKNPSSGLPVENCSATSNTYVVHSSLYIRCTPLQKYAAAAQQSRQRPASGAEWCAELLPARSSWHLLLLALSASRLVIAYLSVLLFVVAACLTPEDHACMHSCLRQSSGGAAPSVRICFLKENDERGRAGNKRSAARHRARSLSDLKRGEKSSDWGRRFSLALALAMPMPPPAGARQLASQAAHGALSLRRTCMALAARLCDATTTTRPRPPNAGERVWSVRYLSSHHLGLGGRTGGVHAASRRDACMMDGGMVP